jgi:hypothetical protein
MDDANDTAHTAGWGLGDDWPTARQRVTVQQAVGALLDLLAPERAPARGGAPAPPVQRLRSPRGCILQGTERAVTVSWFPAAATDGILGELQVITWRGVVSRPGSASRSPGGAVAVRQSVFHPVAGPRDEWVWRGADGTVYDTTALAAACQAQLDDATAHDAPAPVSR